MMKYLAATATLISIVPRIAAVTVNTPVNVVQCQPVMLTFEGNSPFYPSIIPGGQANAAPLRTFPTQNGQSLTWFVDLPAGTPITFAVKDNTGATGYTDAVTIQNSTDSSCVNTSPGSESGLNNDGSTPSAATAKSTQGPAATGAPRPGSAGTSTGANANVPPKQQSPPTTTTTVVRPVGGIQAVSTSTTSSPLASATLATSGAKSRFTFGGLGFAAVGTLVGAFFL